AQNRCFLYHVIGGGTGEWKVPIGGMGAVSDALARAAQRASATLRTGTEVLSLERTRGAIDVVFADRAEPAGRAVSAEHVLVNAAPAELERMLGAARGARATSGAHGNDRARPEGSQLKVNMPLAPLP